MKAIQWGSGNRWLAVAALTVLPMVAPVAAKAQTLEDAIRQALRANEEVLSAARSRDASDQDVRQARAGYLPLVDLRVGSGYQWSDNSNTTIITANGTRGNTRGLHRTESQLTVRQLLYDFGGVDADVDQALARRAQNAHRVREVAEVIALRTADVYIDVLRQRQLLAVTQENVRQHEAIGGRVVARLQSGRGDQADEQQALSRLNVSRSALAEAAGRLREAEIRYFTVVRAPAPPTLAPVRPPLQSLPQSVDQAVQISEGASPTVATFRSQSEFARAQINAADARFLPRIDLEAGGQLNDNIDGIDGRNNDARVMVMMRYNIYSGGADMARRGAAIARQGEANENLRRSIRDTAELVRVAWSQLQTARDRLGVFRAQQDNAIRVRQAYELQFNVGTRSLLDLLDSENELYVARSNVVDTERLQEFRVYRVFATMGTMLQTLNIDPPPESAIPARR
jgi:adhesin transport system outer membrane protein